MRGDDVRQWCWTAAARFRCLPPSLSLDPSILPSFACSDSFLVVAFSHFFSFFLTNPPLPSLRVCVACNSGEGVDSNFGLRCSGQR